jgi:biotin operon repressor
MDACLMRFEQRLRDGIHDGSIVVAFRRWKRSQVVPGHRYRTGRDMVEVESVDIIVPAAITAEQARAAGYPTIEHALADLRGDPALPVYLVRFRRLDEPDPRDELAATARLTTDEVAALSARLNRMDRLSSREPWTMAILRQIADHPGTVSTVLAENLGWPRHDFKLHVRRLKALGLTVSLNPGYRLSPRGQAYLGAVRDAPQARQ